MARTKRAKKKVGLRGYRLHAARIDYSGGTGSMRTIKYPLIGDKDEQGAAIEEAVFDATVHDHRALWGVTNFADYVTWQEKRADDPLLPGEPYSFLGLWVLAIRSGVVFAEANKMTEKFSKLLGLSSAGDAMFAQLSEDAQHLFDKPKWVNFMMSAQRSLEKKTTGQLRQQILDVALKETDADAISAFADTWANRAVAAFNAGELSVFKRALFSLPNESVDDVREADLGIPFALDPTFPARDFKTALDTTQILDEVLAYWGSRSDSPGELIGIGSNGNFFNGFFGSFFEALTSRSPEELAGDIARAYRFSEDQKMELMERLSPLATYARRLPARPHLAGKWADYRSDWNGTLESWYSNLNTKRVAAVEGVVSLRAAAVEFKALLENKAFVETEAYADVCGLLDVIPERVDDVQRSLTEALVGAQAVLRDSLNELAQDSENLFVPTSGADAKKSGSERATDKAPLRRRLDAKVQASPLFFGESQKQYFDKAYKAKAQVRQYVDVLVEVLREELPEDVLLTDKHVQQLAVASLRTEHLDVLSAYKGLSAALGTDFALIEDRKAAYHVSPFARQKSPLLVFGEIPVAEAVRLTRLADLLTVASERMEATLLRDAVGLSKVLSFAVLAAADRTDRATRLKVVTAHSELSGLVAIMSKVEFIARYTLQAVNGDQVRLHREENNGHARYRYGFPKLSGEFVAELTDGWLARANSAALDTKQHSFLSLRVASSRYQVQFFDWLFHRPKGRQTALDINGPFTITEQDVQVDWSGDQPKVHLLGNVDPGLKKGRKPNDLKGRRRRVYTAQPFSLVPEARDRSLTKRSWRFMGVDIGEYGLAYCIIEIEDGRASVLARGFIEDPGQRKLGRDVKALRERQVRATFQSTDTHIARLREHLMGTYKARIEDLAIRYDATVSFELEVSAFESGGSRIAKLYDSVKRGDVFGQTDAAKADNKQAWGAIGQREGVAKDGFRLPWAVEITAGGTSQTCTKCGKWYGLALDPRGLDPSPYRGRARTYTDAAGIGVEELHAERSEEEVKAFRRAVHAAMRPNADGAGMGIVREQFPAFDLAEYVKQRGNSAVYVCPYEDCRHIADADVQAAFNIAVRGYLKATDKALRKGQEAKSGYPISWYYSPDRPRLTFDPVGLVWPLS